MGWGRRGERELNMSEKMDMKRKVTEKTTRMSISTSRVANGECSQREDERDEEGEDKGDE